MSLQVWHLNRIGIGSVRYEGNTRIEYVDAHNPHACHDQFNGMVVVAATEANARDVAFGYAVSQGESAEAAEFYDQALWACDEVALAGEGVVLADFNYG